MNDDYSENIDWDIVYRAFHNPKGVADNIRSALGDVSSPIVFCGFPEVASYLSAHYDIIFVDSSDAIVTNSRARYPHINNIVLSDITTFLESNPAKHVVISGRLSAFWQTNEDFQKIATGLLAYPREMILIDYFDREKVYPGLLTNFTAPAGKGAWDCQKINGSPSNQPPIHNVVLNISYELGTTRFSYLVQRAYFEKNSIALWHQHIFNNYETSLISGLLENDPSFSAKMIAKQHTIL